MSTETGRVVPTSMSQVHLVVAVVDAARAEAFVEFALPSLLSPGNLPALGDSSGWRLRIFASEAVVGAIKSAPAFWTLDRLVRPEFVMLRGGTADTWRQAARALRIATNEALAEQAAVVLLESDVVYPDGVIGSAMQSAKSGTPALVCLPLEADRGAGEALNALRGDAPFLQIASDAAANLALQHLAPASRACFWDAPEVARTAPAVLLRVNSDTVLAHAWRLWPLMVRPVRTVAETDDPLESGEFLTQALDDVGRAVVIQDSHKIFLMRCRPGGAAPCIRGPMTSLMLVRQALFRTTRWQRQTFARPIVIGGRPDDVILAEHVDNLEALMQSALVRPVLRALETSARSGVLRLARSVVRAIRMRAGLTAVAGRVRRAIAPSRARSLVARRASSFIDRAAGRYVRTLARRPGFAREAAIRFHRRIGNAINAELPGYLRTETAASALQVGLASLDDGQLRTAEQGLALARSIRPSPELEFYAQLTATLSLLKTQAEALGAGLLPMSEDRPRYVFAAVVWGNDYIDNFMRYTVRSMLAPGNLPSLADAHVFFSIVTTESGVARIRNHPSFAVLSVHARIHFFVFPEELTKPFHYSRPNFDFYRLYGALDHTSIHFARSLRAGIFFIVVDGLLSSNTIGSLRRFVEEGYWICANASIVSNRESLLPDLDRRYGDEPCIDISARELINLGMQHCHHYIAQRLVVAENRDFDKHPRELYFPTEEGFVVHALYQHPLVISAEAICRDIAFDYFIVDSKLMARILHDPADFPKLKVITDSDEAYVANFAPRSRHFETTGRPLHVDDFVSVHMHSEPVHHYIWQHRQLLKADTGLRTDRDPEVVSTMFLAALKAAQGRQ